MSEKKTEKENQRIEKLKKNITKYEQWIQSAEDKKKELDKKLRNHQNVKASLEQELAELTQTHMPYGYGRRIV